MVEIRILIANGVNLDLLGVREPEHYGYMSLEGLKKWIKAECDKSSLMESLDLVFSQTNSEVEYLEIISKSWDGIVLNPGAWTHTSLALGDRLKGLKTPFVEVHMTNLFSREIFRQTSFTKEHALGVVQGFGCDSYLMGLIGLVRYLHSRSS